VNNVLSAFVGMLQFVIVECAIFLFIFVYFYYDYCALFVERAIIPVLYDDKYEFV